MGNLRLVRIAVSACMTMLLAVVFMDGGAVLPTALISGLLSLQAGPALVRLLSGVSWLAAGLLFVLLLTLLFGRVYCSFLCPLGAVQDVAIWWKKRRWKHRQFPYAPAPFGLHYLVTAAAIAATIAGALFALDLLEPFSNFGKLVTNLLRPAALAMNNGLAMIAGRLGYGILFEVPLAGPSPASLLYTVAFFAGLGYVAYRWGRLYCNSLCPVGGILSVVSRWSLFRIVIREDACIDCGLCTRVCRARCIDSGTRHIDMAACVGCFDCIGSCPTSGMSLRWQREDKKNAGPADPGRREVLERSVKAAALLLAPAAGADDRQPPMPEHRPPVVPPGGRSVEHFTDRCTACHLCVSACPSHILTPALLDYGIAGMMQPRMNYAPGYCTFDCTLCMEVCPTGALLPLTQEEKRVTQIGRTVFVKEDCIVETKKKDCGACSEHCPTKAVRMMPYGKLFLPEVENDYCIGCGACEHACPTQPRKAIYVSASAVHGTARVRPKDRQESAAATPEEFPF